MDLLQLDTLEAYLKHARAGFESVRAGCVSVVRDAAELTEPFLYKSRHEIVAILQSMCKFDINLRIAVFAVLLILTVSLCSIRFRVAQPRSTASLVRRRKRKQFHKTMVPFISNNGTDSSAYSPNYYDNSYGIFDFAKTAFKMEHSIAVIRLVEQMKFPFNYTEPATGLNLFHGSGCICSTACLACILFVQDDVIRGGGGGKSPYIYLLHIGTRESHYYVHCIRTCTYMFN